MNEKKYGVLSSSVDPQKLSLTLKGLVPLVVVLLPLFGVVNVGETDLLNIIDQTLVVVFGVITLWGLARKFKK